MASSSISFFGTTRAAKAPNGGTDANRWTSHACVKGCDEPCVRGHQSTRILQWTPVANLLQIHERVIASLTIP
jgi:hypothetical protein